MWPSPCERSGGLAGGTAVEVEDRDAGAVLREEAGRAEPDAARAGSAGNNSDLAVEQHDDPPFLISGTF